MKSEIKNTKRKSKCNHYAIASNLVKFLEERQLVSFCSSGEVSLTVKEKKGKYYIPLNLYAVYNLSNLDISLLPIKLNLPMVCEPLPLDSLRTESFYPYRSIWCLLKWADWRDLPSLPPLNFQ